MEQGHNEPYDASCVLPRLAIVGAGSGSGKTVITCALLMALQKRGLLPMAYKAGPDYIDPLFHSRALGVPSRNLDMFLCGERAVRYLLAHHGQDKDIAVIEGVMGLYDGLGQSESFSSNHLALLTQTPEILVVTPKGQGLSLVAQLYGYLQFLPNTLKGVIFNQTSEKMHNYYAVMLKERLGLRSFGFLPTLPQGRFEGRSLGLARPETIATLQPQLEGLGEAAEKYLDLDGILELARDTSPLEYSPITLKSVADVTLAVAQDEAFCFYYEDSLELLRRLGARLIPFSPLYDTSLPPQAEGVLLGGGFPEDFAQGLGENSSMRSSLHKAIKGGMPCMAEGGGFLYLCRQLHTVQGDVFPMTGVLDADATMTSSLQRFGYCSLTANEDTTFCPSGESMNAHEYHYAETSDNGASFTARKMNGANWPCIHARGALFAGFPQLHLWGNISLATKFLQACAHYGDKSKN